MKKDDLEKYKDVRVADMNVEGMPWYVKKPEDMHSSAEEGKIQNPPLPLKETWKLIGTSVLLSLLIGGFIFFLFFLFILFCTTVWL